MSIGIVIAFSVSWVYAGGYVLTRYLKEVHFSVILYYHMMIGAFISFIFVFAYCSVFDQPFLKNTPAGWFWISIGAICDFLVVLANTIAL